MIRFLRSAFVIARRDFSATVLSKTFIFFLLGPLFPLLFGGVFGSISARVSSQTQRPVVAVIGSQVEFERLTAARQQMAGAMGDDNLVRLVGFSPEADRAAQQKRLLASRTPPVRAVLSGGLDHPQVAGALGDDPAAVAQLRMLIANARSATSRPRPSSRSAMSRCRPARC